MLSELHSLDSLAPMHHPIPEVPLTEGELFMVGEMRFADQLVAAVSGFSVDDQCLTNALPQVY